MHNNIRVGIVTQTYPERATVRVKLTDSEQVVSYELPVIVRNTLKNKDFAIFDVGEQVVCVFLEDGSEQGFVLGAIYSEADITATVSQDKRNVIFSDGTSIEYDRKTHKLNIHSVGDIKVVSDTHITMIAPKIDLNP